MSKQIYTVTAETVISMIEEIHEEVTAVTMQSIGEVHQIILDSVAEDAEIQCDIVAVITQWVADSTEPVAQQGTGFEKMTAAELREYAETVQAEYDADELSGPSGRQIVRDAWQRVAEAERAESMAVYNAPDAPRDTTPISAEQWEAMHGIGQEPVQDERTIMMIRRQIIEGTAGYFGRTAYDSIRMWRLYSTPSGEIWGAQWTHFRMANGNVIDWQESTWGTMQHVRKFIDDTAELNDTLAEWERY